MLWLLFFLLPLGGSSSEEGAHKTKLDKADSGALGAPAASRPQIYYCRSPNMEVFTCWWHPVEQQAVYVLTYSKDTGPQLECPDYTSGGLHSCYFDKSHTSIWKYYCMTVTAMTPHRNYTSQQHCLDVVEIGTNNLMLLGSVYFLDQPQAVCEDYRRCHAVAMVIAELVSDVSYQAAPERSRLLMLELIQEMSA